MASAVSGDVLRPFAQGRHPQFDHVHPVEQVFAEFAFGNQLGEVLVRCRENPHVDAHLLLFADRAYGLLLNDAQQLDLHVQRQVGNLIEKQGAALGGLNQSLLVADRTGEAAALMAEKLAFHELGGNGPAVDRHEGTVAARAGLVDELRHQFLAGAGFAGYVHRRLAARDARDHFAQVLHGGRRAKQARAEDAGIAVIGLGQLDGRGDQFAQAREIQGLGDEIKSTHFERAHGGLHVAMGGDHGDGYAGEYCCIHLTRSSPSPSGSCMSVRHRSKLLGLEHALCRGDAVGGARTQVHALAA